MRSSYVRLQEKATFIGQVPRHFLYPRDPKDEKYLNLAIEVAAAYLVSRDKDLLDLMTSDAAACQGFRQRFPSLQIIEPLSLLQLAKRS